MAQKTRPKNTIWAKKFEPNWTWDAGLALGFGKFLCWQKNG